MECAPRAGERPSQVEYRPISGFHVLNSGFKLVRRNIADGRMKALPVIDFLEKKRKPFDWSRNCVKKMNGGDENACANAD